MTGPEAIGVDLGGTKLLVGVVGAGPEVLHRDVSESRGLSRQELLALLDDRLADARAARPDVGAIGLGVPCTIDRAAGLCVKAVHLPLAGVELRDRTAAAHGLPTSLDNDSSLAALGEWRHGAARGVANVVMLTIGTGVGGGLILDGEIYRGSSGAAAELGHVVVVEDGPPCNGSCPGRGCLEAVVSGTAIAREGQAAAERDPGSVLAAGGPVDAPRVIAAAREGDAAAAGVLAEAGRLLGVALAGFANTFDPDLIVLGGGVMEAGELLAAPARDELRARALPPQRDVPVAVAELGPDAGMIGAATLALDEAGAAAVA